MAMGALAGTLGSFLRTYQTAVNILSGIVVILFGLHFMGVLSFRLFRQQNRQFSTENLSFFSSLVFGIVFSVSWTPCVGVFLGSALALASQQGHIVEGMSMLLCYSLGLGIPFLLSALLIDHLKSAFSWIKQHYKIINTLCGAFLILVGILMATGTLNWLLGMLGGSV